MSDSVSHRRIGDAPIQIGLVAAAGLALLYYVPLLFGNREAPPPVAAPVTAAPTTFTYVEFSRIEQGMSLDQVNELLGGPGTLQVTRKVQNFVVTQRVWTNQNGATATVVFANEQVVQAFQFGF